MLFRSPCAVTGKTVYWVDKALLEVACDAAAQGAPSILPYFDEITRQAGIET